MTKRIEHVDENGLLHHDTEPAFVNENGDQWWFLHDKRHRDNDLPAVIFTDGTQYWFLHGKEHRDNDLPAVVQSNGTQSWYLHSKRHRTNGPARITSDNNRRWVVNGHQLQHGILFNQSIYSCFPSELVASPIFDFLRYILTDPVKDKLR